MGKLPVRPQRMRLANPEAFLTRGANEPPRGMKGNYLHILRRWAEKRRLGWDR